MNRYRKKSAKTTTATSHQNNGGKGNNHNNGDNNVSKNNNGTHNKQNNDTARAAPFLYFPPERVGLWPTQFVDAAVKPYRLVPRNWRQELPHALLVFLAVAFLYGYTTPRLVALEDDGLFIANMHYFGVAHPPGYPIHTFLGGIFYHLLPFGTPAFKGHFFSGFTGAIACSAIYATIAMLVRGRIFAYLGGLAYGASDTFWSQAIIAEVYTLNSMFFFIVLALCVRYAGHIGRAGRNHNRLFMAITFIYGLGLANHYPILGLGSIGLGMIVLSQLRNILPRAVKGLCFLMLGAFPPYLWMVWRSLDPSPANFYGPIDFLGLVKEKYPDAVDFGFYALRKGYSGVDKQAGVGLEDKLIFGEALGNDMLWQFTPVGFIFVVLGFYAMARSRYNWLWLSLLTSWFMSSVLLVFLLDFKAGYIWLAAFRVYHLLAFGIMAIWLALGAAWLVDKLRFLPEIMRRQMGFLIILAVVGSSLVAHWDLNNRHDYRWAHDLAMAKISSVEPNAALFLFDDLDLPVGYIHYVEGVRSDLEVYNDQGLVYGKRLYSPLIPNTTPKNRPDVRSKATIVQEFARKTDRPIYYHTARTNLHKNAQVGSDMTGFFRRVNRTGPADRIILSDSLLKWLNSNADLHGKITDRWTRQQHYSTVAQLVNAVQVAAYSGFKINDIWQEVIDRSLDKNALARLNSNQQRLNFGRMDKEGMARELVWLERFDPTREDLLEPRMRGLFYTQKALISRNLETVDDEEYEAILQQGIAQHDAADNPAVQYLLSHYHKKEQHCDFIHLIERLYPNAENIPKNMLRPLRKARKEEVCV
ncbi:DUF2723 domain-containing protein [Candidatus Persebacteraceae bacterium Df01]|uniref:DUF2723 domain-containing protein n=1 Tax=Candidatus Doriopsillibacter californiensis TaxID=2970740 RepID=A0ABT7QKD2_9GAMM|nr:DUF2723 domain-containing protein [Candidatus Persebacteraceae bacterium Df01]